MKVGAQVKFTHKVQGELIGTIVKVFKNGKASVTCAAHYSSANGNASRKTTYNVECSALISVPPAFYSPNAVEGDSAEAIALFVGAI